MIKDNKKPFVGNVSTLMIGTLISQTIPMLAAPILTRLYTPEEFGVMALFISISSIIAVFCNLRFDAAIVSADDEKETEILKRLSLFSNITISLFTLLIIIIFNAELSELSGSMDLKYVLYLIPLFIFFNGLLQMYTYLANRKGDFKGIAKSKIDKNFGMIIVQLVLGVMLKGFISLIFGLIIGTILGLRKIFIRNTKLKISFEEYYQVAVKYKEFPLISTSTAFVDKLSVEAPTLLLNRFYSPTEVGYFDLTKRIIAGPLSIISTSISQVYFKRVSDLKSNRSQLIVLTIRILALLTVVSLIIGVTFYYQSVNIFRFVFGDEWAIAGEYAKILVFAFLIRFIVSPLSVVFLVPGKTKYGAVWQLMYFIVTIIVSLIYLPQGINIYIIAFTIFEIVMYLIYLFMIFVVLIKRN